MPEEMGSGGSAVRSEGDAAEVDRLRHELAAARAEQAATAAILRAIAASPADAQSVPECGTSPK